MAGERSAAEGRRAAARGEEHKVVVEAGNGCGQHQGLGHQGLGPVGTAIAVGVVFLVVVGGYSGGVTGWWYRR